MREESESGGRWRVGKQTRARPKPDPRELWRQPYLGETRPLPDGQDVAGPDREPVAYTNARLTGRVVWNSEKSRENAFGGRAPPERTPVFPAGRGSAVFGRMGIGLIGIGRNRSERGVVCQATALSNREWAMGSRDA